MLLWLILGPLLIYFLYTRFWKVYTTIQFYKKQGIPFHSRILPIFGSQLDILKFVGLKDKTKGHPFNEFVEATFFKGKNEVPPIVGFALGNTVALMVNSPYIAEELFLTKNKIF
jgi:hypothetical protein